MLRIEDIKKTDGCIRFISAAIMGILVTICLGMVALPYYWAYHLINNGYNNGWYLVFGWTWLVSTSLFHLLIKWIDKGKEEGKNDKEISKLTREN